MKSVLCLDPSSTIQICIITSNAKKQKRGESKLMFVQCRESWPLEGALIILKYYVSAFSPSSHSSPFKPMYNSSHEAQTCINLTAYLFLDNTCKYIKRWNTRFLECPEENFQIWSLVCHKWRYLCVRTEVTLCFWGLNLKVKCFLRTSHLTFWSKSLLPTVTPTEHQLTSWNAFIVLVDLQRHQK